MKALTLTGYVEWQSDPTGRKPRGCAQCVHRGYRHLSQGTYAGSFSVGSPFVAGATYAFGSRGMDSNGTANLAGGLALLHSHGTVSRAMAINDIVNSFGFTITGGTYTVDPTGRVTLSNVASPLVCRRVELPVISRWQR